MVDGLSLEQRPDSITGPEAERMKRMVQQQFPALHDGECLLLVTYSMQHQTMKQMIEAWPTMPQKEAAKNLLRACKTDGAIDNFLPLLLQLLQNVFYGFASEITKLLLEQFLSDIGTTVEDITQLEQKRTIDTGRSGHM